MESANRSFFNMNHFEFRIKYMLTFEKKTSSNYICFDSVKILNAHFIVKHKNILFEDCTRLK